MAGVGRKRKINELEQGETSIIPVYWGPYGDNYGTQVRPNYIIPPYMNVNFTRFPSEASPLGGVNQPGRPINAIALNAPEFQNAFIVDPGAGVCSISDVGPGLEGGGETKNAWNCGNALYLGGMDKSDQPNGRRGGKVQTRSIIIKGTASLSSNTDGFKESVQDGYLNGIRFTMLKASAITITIVVEKEKEQDVVVTRNSAPEVAGKLPNWGEIFSYCTGTSKNAENVLLQNQGGLLVRKRFSGNLPKVSVNSQNNYKILKQKRYYISCVNPVVPIDIYFAMTASTGETDDAKKAAKNYYKHQNAGVYSTAAYKQESPDTNYETQLTNSIFLITSTDLISSDLLVNTFGFDAEASYPYFLQSVYPQWNCITSCAKKNV